MPTSIAAPDVSIEQTAGRKFTFYGYQFEVPWTDVKQEKHLKSIELVYFSNDFFIKLKLLTRSGTDDEAGLKKYFR